MANKKGFVIEALLSVLYLYEFHAYKVQYSLAKFPYQVK